MMIFPEKTKRCIVGGMLGITLLFLFAACGQKSTNIVSRLVGYDVNNPKRILKLPPLLDEISGISYYAKDSSLFAVQDEEGFIYKLFLNRPDSMLRFKFSGRGDFEDVLLHDSTFYVLRSDGDIFATKIGADVKSNKSDFPDKGNEFEGIYYDDARGIIRLLCKDCKEDKKKFVTTYSFNPATGQYINDSVRIDAKEIAEIQGEKKTKFKPSAIAVHPIDHKLYIISAINEMLVVANPDGSISATAKLDKRIYKQPEGIAFAPDGTMFITNEWGEAGAATLITIPYHTTTK
jgi:uncharacterized protein YjiK